jgi:hypothetical protein
VARNIQFFIIKHTSRYQSPGQKVARSGTLTLTFTSTFTWSFASLSSETNMLSC